MNSVQCTGSEKSVTECHFRPVPLYTCKHNQDVAVRCNVPNTGIETTVRNEHKNVQTQMCTVGRTAEKYFFPLSLLLGASGRRERAVTGPCGGADWSRRSKALGICLQWKLGLEWGHGGLSSAGLGLCLKCSSGGKNRIPCVDVFLSILPFLSLSFCYVHSHFPLSLHPAVCVPVLCYYWGLR